MFLPDRIISKLRDHYKEGSVKVYDNVILKLFRGLHSTSTPTKLVFETSTPTKLVFEMSTLEDTKSVTKYLESIEPKESKRILVIINTILKHTDTPPQSVIDYYAKISKNLARHVKLRSYAKPSDVTRYATLESLINLRTTRTPGTRDYLLLTLYTSMPPLRGEEWCSLRISVAREIPETGNYLDMNSWTLILRDYKTSKQYGERKIRLPEEIISVLKNYIDAHITLTPNDGNFPYLFPGQNGERGLSSQAFNDCWCRLTSPHRVSTSMLRKIYISEMMRYVRKTRTETEAAHISDSLAWIMGHSVATQEFTYNRLRDLDCSSDEYLSRLLGTLESIINDNMKC